MIHRPFGNLDKIVKSSSPSLSTIGEKDHSIGIVESVDSKTFIIKIRDCQTGQRGIECSMMQSNFATLDKSGTFELPLPESKVLYMMTGGNIGIILGNIVTALIDRSKGLKDGVTVNPGFENFNNVDGPSDVDLPSDFGWNPGDRGWITEHGKIKLTRAGIVVLKSSPFCYMYMLPAKQSRLSQFLYDEERGIGYLKRRRTFMSPLLGTALNCNYKLEQIDDIPSAPKAYLKEEKGFIDKSTAHNSLNHQSDLDIRGHISNAINGESPITNTRAIRRTTIATTEKRNGSRTLCTPVYKKEERVDGTVIEQSGREAGKPVYNLEIVKSPNGYMHVVSRSNANVKIILKFDPNTGMVELHADKINFTAKQSITLDAPEVNINASTSIKINSTNVDIDAQAAMKINAPSIASLPTAAPLINNIAQPVLTKVNLDNSPLDEVPLD
jgi:phage gp45-like